MLHAPPSLAQALDAALLNPDFRAFADQVSILSLTQLELGAQQKPQNTPFLNTMQMLGLMEGDEGALPAAASR